MRHIFFPTDGTMIRPSSLDMRHRAQKAENRLTSINVCPGDVIRELRTRLELDFESRVFVPVGHFVLFAEAETMLGC